MNKKDEFGLKPETIQALMSVFQRYPQIKQVIIYGSRAKGNYKPGSDIDLTLDAPALQLSDLLKIENDIDDLSLPYKIDLSLLHKIENENLLDHIRRVGLSFKER